MNLKIIFYVVVTILIIVTIYFFGLGTDNISRDTDHIDDIESYEIAPSFVVEKIKNNENIALLDVRTLEEYEEMHIENSLLLPVQELTQETLNKIGLGEEAKDKEIIIYCRSGARSKTAYDIMDSLGYTNIKSIAGGMIHWQEDEYPFTKSGKYEGIIIESNLNSDTTNDGPSASFDRIFHDFGVIPQYGGVVDTTFTLKNDGTETLIIGNITTSCSCTSASISSPKIPVNGEAILTVVFDPNFHDEPLDVFKRTVFIPTNDSNQNEIEITIQVDIKEGE